MGEKWLVKSLKLIVMLICAIVGVGFVSGAEIVQFYSRFGKNSYFGLIVFFLLIFVLVLKILTISNNSENELKMNNLNKICTKNTFLLKFKIKNILTNINILMVASAMFSGLFVVIKRLFINNYYYIVILLIIIVFLILYFGIRGLEKFDCFVVLFILFLIVSLLVFMFKDNTGYVVFNQVTFSYKNIFKSALFSILYVFMNIVQIQPILNEFNFKRSRKLKIIFSFVFSLILTLMLFVLVRFLIYNNQFSNFEMPLIHHFKNYKLSYYIYILGLILALLSSLLSCLIGVKRNLNLYFKSNIISTGLSIFFALILSFIGFSNFISIVYPIIGVVNFIIFVFL